MRGVLAQRLRRRRQDSIPGESRPAEYSWPCLSLVQSPLFEPRLVRALISAARHERTDFGNPSQLSGCPNSSISRWPATPELLRPQMRLENGLEAQRLLPLLPRMVGSPW
jgi:hypothetical protein